jgi:hypothetical protein
MITIDGMNYHGRLTLGSKRKRLRKAKETLREFKALAMPTAKQRIQIMLLECEIPRLELSIKAWS